MNAFNNNAFAAAMEAVAIPRQLETLAAINRIVLAGGLTASRDNLTIDIMKGDTFKGQATVREDGKIVFLSFLGTRWPEVLDIQAFRKKMIC